MMIFFLKLERSLLEKALQIHRANLAFFELQAAVAGPLGVTLHLHNQLEKEIKEIARINEEIARINKEIARFDPNKEIVPFDGETPPDPPGHPLIITPAERIRRELWFGSSVVGTTLLAISSRLDAFPGMALLCILLISSFTSWLLIQATWLGMYRETGPLPSFGIVQAVGAALSLLWITTVTPTTEVGVWVCCAGFIFIAWSGLISLARWWF